VSLLWIPTRDARTIELKLAISLDLEDNGWLVEMITSASDPNRPPTYSRVVIPMSAVERGTTDPYVDALLVMHLTFLGFR